MTPHAQSGPGNGIPVILLHGFPYDPRAYDAVVAPLVSAGCRTIVPYLRGYGPTRFLATDAPRSGQPHWRFDDATYERTATSFDNPDFVEVVIHSYRHRFGSAPGDPALEAIEQRLAEQPPIRVPTIVLHGGDDGVTPPEHARFFTGPFERRVIHMAGHNLPQEVPGPVVEAVLASLAG